MLDDGMESFEFECQCNTEYGTYEEGETIHAPVNQIIHKTLPYRRFHIPQDTYKIVSHIDVNKEILTYTTISSPEILQGHFCSYGTHPKQPALWSKRNIIVRS